jgi:hypothetical protein
LRGLRASSLVWFHLDHPLLFESTLRHLRLISTLDYGYREWHRWAIPGNIAWEDTGCRENPMQEATIQTELFVTLAEHYEHDPREFVRLPQQTVDSSFARVAVAELRNEGYVEEQVRGVVRLTLRGYNVYKSKPHPAA